MRTARGLSKFIDVVGSTQSRTFIMFKNKITITGVTDSYHGSGSTTAGRLLELTIWLKWDFLPFFYILHVDKSVLISLPGRVDDRRLHVPLCNRGETILIGVQNNQSDLDDVHLIR